LDRDAYREKTYIRTTANGGTASTAHTLAQNSNIRSQRYGQQQHKQTAGSATHLRRRAGDEKHCLQPSSVSPSQELRDKPVTAGKINIVGKINIDAKIQRMKNKKQSETLLL
jgi:hypothetical protein